ncbi:cleavage stimulation factor subunit 2 [Sporothrix brasiliensis 5110]|uniref:Cleavage stimulation factor subunit 2 n=1 Tax=Sporothrix brasiliensis 5110 TaxID=1398154 RepID=A0A0C2J3Z6_9PEZI|nr:cleavage stimulation factor subunit 2 [Sporothrix brasiliensis 5110]KIH91802.1 cleavage stimulation factor subunit 2 [Sporothrix brasiliensis 5110]
MSRQPSKIVFVGNIPYGLSEEQISDIFSSAGRVVSFRLVYDRENGKPKGFGFAEYPDPDSAASAVRNLNDYEVMGRKLRVDFSNEGHDEDMPASMGGSNTYGGPGTGTSSNGPAASTPMAATGSSNGSSSLPPLPPGKDIPPGASATDEISRVLRTLPPTQLLDVLTQMKTLATNEPARATELLAQAPQLAYAVFQALLLMDLVSPEAIQAVVEATPAVPVVPQQQAPPPPPPPPAAYAAYQPELAPPVAAPPAAAPAAPGQDELIKQVLELPQAVIDQLPEAERTQLMALRMQYGGGAR